MKTGMLALALGLLALRWLPVLPPGAGLLAMLVLALMLLRLLWRQVSPPPSPLASHGRWTRRASTSCAMPV